MKNIKRFGICLLGLVVFIASCKKDYDPDFTLPRQFKPGDINVTAGETAAVLKWSSSLFTTAGNVTYTVEVSTDSTFQGTPVFSRTVDTPTVTVTDSVLVVMQNYYARVRANQNGNTAASGWVTSKAFKITGEQIFQTIADVDLKDTSVLLKWRPTTGLTNIRITPLSGSPYDVPLTPADLLVNQKLIKGLSPLTTYKAEIFRNTVLKGNITFTTKERNIYATILTSGQDLVTAVANAANGDIIGLQPGTYNCVDGTGAYVNLTVQQKTITIQSLSNNPNDTKVNFKEVTLKGTGAGVTLKGINFDGAAANATSAQASYFVNLVGLAADGDAATFTDVKVENCWVHNMGNCLMRANRASSNGGHKIDTVSINNCKVYDNQAISAYTFFTLDKLEFRALLLTNSTFYNLGRGFISYSTNMTFPVAPSVLIDHCTINGFGRDARTNFFVDANGNPGTVAIRNDIIANTPLPGQTVATSLVRASVATVTLSNSDYFKLNDGTTTTPLSWPAIVAQSANQTIDLGWTATTTDFTLPAASPLRTASSTGGAIGDPRWAN